MKSDLFLSRRAFLKAGAAASGGLLIAMALDSGERLAWAAEMETPAPFAGWVHIRPDGRVTVKLPGTEMGQGHATAMPMLVAEELEADWALVDFELAEGDPKYVNPLYHMQSTTGSMSVRGYSELLRKIGCAGRLMLIGAAAKQWSVSAEQCQAEASFVRHPPTGRKAQYGEIADAAAAMPLPTEIRLKPPSAWKLLGKPTPRLDSHALVTGSAAYGQDVRLPGMLMGAIAFSPVFGGKLKSVDERPALASPGVKAVVPLRGAIPLRDDAVAVVADTTWHAFKGLRALTIEWDAGANAALDDAGLWGVYRAALDEPGTIVEQRGDAARAIDAAARRVEAQYEVPYLAHAPLEPMNATASYKPDFIEIWVPTQASGMVQMAVARAFGLRLEQVKVHVTFVGGGFGRRGDVDYAFPAVWASKALGVPVQVVWSREEDMRHDSYRPATAIRMRGGLDAAGGVTGITIKHSNSSIAARLMPQLARGGLDPISHFGFTNSPYEFPARQVEYAMRNQPVPVGFWRSVSSTYTGFAMESFLDTLAEAAHEDPIRFRVGLLRNHPRHTAVLERLAAESGWNTPTAQGHVRGVALHDSQGSIVGQVVELSVQGSAYHVHRIVAVVDAGLVINPLTAEAQIAGGIVFGLTAAQYGAITIKGGAVQQSNYYDYPLLRMADMPPIEVHFMKNEEPHGGIGEPGVPPIAPALVNALFAATGKRIGRLPLASAGFRLA
ncbi:MAG TPA: molybdopterin cofactor-binding domain-containing protein [bacterium]|nr:molybdopterin cofactor-binding domain-containing protein [bacterium]